MADGVEESKTWTDCETINCGKLDPEGGCVCALGRVPAKCDKFSTAVEGAMSVTASGGSRVDTVVWDR
jgi:hypothetical protein